MNVATSSASSDWCANEHDSPITAARFRIPRRNNRHRQPFPLMASLNLFYNLFPTSPPVTSIRPRMVRAGCVRQAEAHSCARQLAY